MSMLCVRMDQGGSICYFVIIAVCLCARVCECVCVCVCVV